MRKKSSVFFLFSKDVRVRVYPGSSDGLGWVVSHACGGDRPRHFEKAHGRKDREEEQDVDLSSSSMSNFSQGQDWSTAGWGSKGPASGATKQQALNAARRAGTIVAEAKCASYILVLSRVEGAVVDGFAWFRGAVGAATNKSAHQGAGAKARKLEEDHENFKRTSERAVIFQAAGLS
jgi:hypothetical protein